MRTVPLAALTAVLVALVLGAGPAPAQLSAGAVAGASRTAVDEPRRFWVRDEHRYSSPWYAGERRKMINYGCTRAPYYDPDPRCTERRGFHHGLDLAMPCGTRLFAGFRGWVVRPNAPGALGPAYGAKAFRIRNHAKGVDVVLGHVQRVYVDPGDRVRRGMLVARAGKLAAPDGCHLHFEVRPIGKGHTSAVRPHPYLMLER